MDHPAPPPPLPQRRPLGFLASGGWVLLAALIVTLAAGAWTLLRWNRTRGHAVGDGTDIETYGFVLEPCLVPRDTLVAAGMPKDGLPAIITPEIWSLARYDAFATGRHSRFLVPSDRVVSVTVAGQARAYPLRILAWHEVVNDTLGGLPIAVTYHPLCDSVAVFRRDPEGTTLTFGVSGLLSNSNQLLYDRQNDPNAESLWSQLRLRAVTGPAAGRGARLTPLPTEEVPWGDWRAAHPDGTVLAPVMDMLPDYAREPYGSYFGNDLLRFPAAPLPPWPDLARKTPTAVALVRGTAYAFPLPLIDPSGRAQGSVEVAAGPEALTITWKGYPPALSVRSASGAPVPAVYSFLFAWYAAHPDDTVWFARRGR